MTRSKRTTEKESGGADDFALAASTEPPTLKSRFVSTETVGIGDGVSFELASVEMVPDRFNEGSKILEVKGHVIESRADGLVDEGEVTVACRAARLEQFGNAVAADGLPGSRVTLVRGEDEGKKAGWRWTIAPPVDEEPAEGEPAE